MKFPMIIVAAILLAGSVNAQEAIPEALQSEISPLQSTIDDLGGGVIQGANSAADCFKLPSDIAQIGCLTAKLQEEDSRLESAYRIALGELRHFNETSEVEAIRTAERDWIRFRDANCLERSLRNPLVSRQVKLTCLIQMTLHRQFEMSQIGD